MDIALYTKVVDEIAHENPQTVLRPFDGGEPLMRKDMEDLILYAKHKGIQYVSINTNGTLLTRERALRVLKSGLDHIEFSIDAASSSTYASIKNADLYQKLMQNLETFLLLKQRLRPKMRISVSFVEQLANYHECELFMSYWRGRVDRVNIREYHQHSGLVASSGLDRISHFKYRHPCPYLWERLIVQHDGRVRFCENDWTAENTKIGDAKTQSLKEIWLSPRYRSLRQSHVEGTFSHPFCSKCPDWETVR